MPKDQESPLLYLCPKTKRKIKRFFHSICKIPIGTLTCRHGPEKRAAQEKKTNNEPTVNVFLAYGAPGVRSSSEVTGLFNTVRQTQNQGAPFIHSCSRYFTECFICDYQGTKGGKKDPCLTVILQPNKDRKH